MSRIALTLAARSFTSRAERLFFEKESITPADPRDLGLYVTSAERAGSRIADAMAVAIIELLDRYPDLGQ